jgi:hypothetical protein
MKFYPPRAKVKKKGAKIFENSGHTTPVLSIAIGKWRLSCPVEKKARRNSVMDSLPAGGG